MRGARSGADGAGGGERGEVELDARPHRRGDRGALADRCPSRRPAWPWSTASTKARMFSASCSSPNDALPTEPWTMPAFSTRNSTAPPLDALTAAATSIVTVPTFGFGIRPRGPEHLAEPADQRHQVGRGDAAVEIDRAALDGSPRDPRRRRRRRPAARASSALAPRANTATRNVRPVPLGRLTTPRTIWSACLGSTPRLSASSTVSSNLARGRCLDELHRLVELVELGALDASRALLTIRLPCVSHGLPHHLEAHRTGGAFDHLHRRLDRVAVEIDDLLLGDLAHLRLASPCRRSRGPASWSRRPASCRSSGRPPS